MVDSVEQLIVFVVVGQKLRTLLSEPRGLGQVVPTFLVKCRYVVLVLHQMAGKLPVNLFCSGHSKNLFMEIVVILILSGYRIFLYFRSVLVFLEYFLVFRKIRVDSVFLSIFFPY